MLAGFISGWGREGGRGGRGKGTGRGGGNTWLDVSPAESRSIDRSGFGKRDLEVSKGIGAQVGRRSD